MAWFIRKFLQLIIILGVLLAITAVAAFLFVSPNNFRGKINEFIQDHTGYQIEAKGPLDWSLGTNIVLKLNDVTLVGPQGFKSPFLNAKTVNVSLDLFSMFKENLVITNLEVIELVAVVERQASGSRNIDALKPSNVPGQMMTIRELNIKNSTLMYQDDQTNHHWALNNLNIGTRNLTLFPTTNIEPFTIKADIANLDHNLSFNIDATISLDSQQHTINFDPLALTWHGVKLSGKTAILQYNQDPQVSGTLNLDNLDVSVLLASFNTDIASVNGLDIDQIKGSFTFNVVPETRLVTISDFLVELGEGTIKGESQLVLAGPYKANFNVTANNMNIIPLAALARGLIPLISKLPGVSGMLDLIKSVEVDGKFAGTELTLLDNFKVEHVTADLKIDKGNVQFGPVTAKAYGAAHNASIELDLNQQPPAVKLNQQGDNIALATWLSILRFPPILTGTANTKIAIDANGYNLMQFKESATGNVNLSAKAGTIIGLDIDKLQQYSVISMNDVMNQLASNKNLDLNVIVKPKAADWASTQKSNPVSTYETLELSVDIKQGVSTTNVKISSAAYELSGTGTFNLANNGVKFDTQIINKEITPTPLPEIADFLKGAQLPVAVSGSLEQMVFKPDLQNYIVNTIKQAQDTLQKKAVASMVAATGPDAKTSKTAEEIFVESLKGLKQ